MSLVGISLSTVICPPPFRLEILGESIDKPHLLFAFALGMNLFTYLCLTLQKVPKYNRVKLKGILKRTYLTQNCASRRPLRYFYHSAYITFIVWASCVCSTLALSFPSFTDHNIYHLFGLAWSSSISHGFLVFSNGPQPLHDILRSFARLAFLIWDVFLILRPSLYTYTRTELLK